MLFIKKYTRIYKTYFPNTLHEENTWGKKKQPLTNETNSVERKVRGKGGGVYMPIHPPTHVFLYQSVSLYVNRQKSSRG